MVFDARAANTLLMISMVAAACLVSSAFIIVLEIAI